MLLRFDPFRDFDRVAEQVTRTPAVPMDASRHDSTVVVRFDLPGVHPDDIDLEVERNVLTLAARRSWDRQEGEQVLAAERRHGSFTRQLQLSDNLDTAKVAADYTDGVLTVTIPIAETAKARKISVSGGGETQAIEAEATDAG
jgi:HSP20 family protein